MEPRGLPRIARSIRAASASSEAPIWSRVAELAAKPSSARRTVNVNKIGRLTSEGQTVMVPGKVLGTGSITHAVTLCAFAISRAAAGKVRRAGGSIVSVEEIIKANPAGTEVRLLG